MSKQTLAFCRVAILGLAVICIAGCGATSPQVAYYSLLGTEPPPASAEHREQLALSVGPVTVPGVLKQTQIATGGTEGRYHLSEEHRWTGDLDAEIARAVAEQLANRLGTQKVVVFPWDQNIQATRRVMLDVLAMGGAPGKEANLAVRWALIDPKGELPAVVRRSDLREIPTEAGYPAWVKAQQRNLARLGDEIAAAVKGTVTP